MSTLWFEAALRPSGWDACVRLTIHEGRIASIEAGVAPLPQDERHAVALPGMPNLHSHAFQRGMAGLAERRGPAGDTFWTWREVMYRFVDRLEPDDVAAIAAQAYVEMLESGFTRVGEFHYLHHDPSGAPYANVAELASRIAEAAGDTGIALTLLPVFYAHGDFGGQAATRGQRRFVTTLDRFAALLAASRTAIATLPDARLGLAPHSLRAATLEAITALVPLAAGGPIHIHVAEQVREVEACLAWCGRRPVETLLDGAPVDAAWCLIHATHMSPAEITRVAASGAVVGLCPITESSLGDGIFAARPFLEAGGRFGLGTDSNVLIDGAGEMRTLEYSQRLAGRARNLLATAEGESTGRAIFDAALAGGSQALGMDAPGADGPGLAGQTLGVQTLGVQTLVGQTLAGQKSGVQKSGAYGLVAGAPADIVSLDTAHPALAARQGDALLDGWIFATSGRAVDCVWRAGVKVVEAGHHRRRQEIAARYRQVLARVLAPVA